MIAIIDQKTREYYDVTLGWNDSIATIFDGEAEGEKVSHIIFSNKYTKSWQGRIVALAVLDIVNEKSLYELATEELEEDEEE